jgi:hypothetical protein
MKPSDYASYQVFSDGSGDNETDIERDIELYNARGINKNEKNEKKKDLCPFTMGGYVQEALSDDNDIQPKQKKQKGDMPKRMQDAFDVFWSAYPRKVSKGDARKVWKQIQPSSELLTKMLSALGRAKTCSGWIKDGGQYIPYPASWLRAEGWEDEIKSTQKSAPSDNERRET